MFITFKCKICRVIKINPTEDYLKACTQNCTMCPDCSKAAAAECDYQNEVTE